MIAPDHELSAAGAACAAEAETGAATIAIATAVVVNLRKLVIVFPQTI
jgi:hypothetical protein